MPTVLKQRNFAFLWFGQLISAVGDWLLFIALPFYIYALTGSTLATGGMFIAQLLPSLLLGSLAGVFVDRWDRRRVMIVSDLLRGVVLLLLLVVRSTDALWLIYLVVFVQSAIGQFFVPAKNALIPRLVDGADLVSANSLNATSDSLTRLIGPTLGGIMFAAFGLSSVVAVDALSFFVSAVLILWMVVPLVTAADTASTSDTATRVGGVPLPSRETVGVSAAHSHAAPASADDVADSSAGAPPIRKLWSSIWSEWLAGLRFVCGDRMLAPLFVIMGVFSLADAVFTTLLVAFAQSIMRVGATELGWIMASQGVGGLLGGLVLVRLGDRVPPQRWIALTCIADGLLLLVIFNVPVVALALVLIFAAGILMVGANISITTLLQTGAADDYRGRVFGAWQTTGGLTRLVGVLLAGTLAEVFGVLPLLDSAASLWLIAGVLTVAFLPGVVGRAAVVRRPALSSRSRP